MANTKKTWVAFKGNLTIPADMAGQDEDLQVQDGDLDTQIAYAELEASFPEPKMVEQSDGSVLPVHSPITAAKVNRFWLARLSGVSEDVVGKVKDSDLEAVNAAAEAVLGLTSGKDKGADAGDASGNEAPAK